jgi:hypothetical protein
MPFPCGIRVRVRSAHCLPSRRSHDPARHTAGGETLITPDAPICALYFPLDAVVSVVGTLADGTQLEVGTIGNEGVVGVARFLRATRMPFTAVAQVPGAALRMDAETFDQAVGLVGSDFADLLARYTQARFMFLEIYRDPVPEPDVPEPVVPELPLPEPVVPVSVPLEPVPGRLLVPESVVPELPLPEPIVPELPLPEPVVPVSVPLEPVPGRLLVPEPIVPELPLPEPVVPVSVPLEPVPGRPLVPEPLIPELPLPEPLLPDPEACASTNGAVTTSTARAATTVLLNLLNISLCSSSLEGCACLVSLCDPCSPALHSAWEPRPGGKGAILMPEAQTGQRALSDAIMWHRPLLF